MEWYTTRWASKIFWGDLWLAGLGSCRLGLEVGLGLEELVGEQNDDGTVDKYNMEVHFQARALDIVTQMVVKKMVNSNSGLGIGNTSQPLQP